MIWFTADTHYRSRNVLKYMPARGAAFADADAMDAHFISECNRVVKPNDELRVLGDWIWGSQWYGSYRMKLAVRRIHFIMGNHDRPSIAQHVSSCREVAYVKFNDIRFHLFHFPIASWRNRERNTIHLYGHCHGKFEDCLNRCFPGRFSMDVGIDNAFKLLGEWRPFSLDEIFRLLKHPGPQLVDPRVCKHRHRNMNGGCPDCGDPCL